MLIVPIPVNQHQEEVEEAGYLASASDLMIGLLFVFIIMVVLLSQRVEEITHGTKNPDPLSSAVQAIGETIKKAGVNVQIDPASGVIRLPSDTLFAFGQSDLSTEGIEALTKARGALNGILPCYIYSERSRRSLNCPSNPKQVEIETIFIEGHTDSAPLQRGNYTNWHLGLDRARAVYEVLTNGSMQDFKNERTLDVLGVSSYADKRPVSKFDSSSNRRVELRIVLAFKPESNSNSVAGTKTKNQIEKSISLK
jgi:chemotaxis protein MotB